MGILSRATLAALGAMWCVGVAQAQANACLADSGNPPRATTKTVPGDLSGGFVAALNCSLRGGEVLSFTDINGTLRSACLRVPPGTSLLSKRPLVVFLGGARSSSIQSGTAAGLDLLYRTANLSGSSLRKGFVLLTVEGRDTQKFYPAPTDQGTGWDVWYRNLNRNDPAINVDAAALDRFVAQVEQRGIVEAKRKYVMGWSNGGAMALLYGMNTPGVAATVAYSSSDPYADQFDPCPQAPFASNRRPVMTLHNRCDLFGFCATGGLGFGDRVRGGVAGVPVSTVLIDGLQRRSASCDASCSYDVRTDPASRARRGALQHAIWPSQWNDDFMTFLRNNPRP